MYLVLTALLALNVSREMLHAFLFVNESMQSTNEKFAEKIEETYAEFQKQFMINKEKVRPYWEKAVYVQDATDEIVDYLDSVKYTIIAKTEGITVEEAKMTPLSEIKKKDNFDRPTTFFIGAEYNGEAYTIKEQLNEYRNTILQVVDEKSRDNLSNQLGLRTDGTYYNADGEQESWELHHFYHTILAADVTILNKLIAEAYNAELDVINYLYSSITAEDFKFDKVGAKVIPNSNYIFEGDDYNAEILVAAYETKRNLTVFYLEGSDTLLERNLSRAKKIEGKGSVKLELPATSTGTKKYAGIIQMVTPWGDTNSYHFKHSYLVAEPSATVSATKMNVFYRGVENPVSISASGKADAQIDPRMNGGRIVRTDDGWVVRDLSPDIFETVVKIYADDNGGQRFMGEQLFRVKMLPNPIAKVLGATDDGKITKNKLLTNPFLHCQLPEWVDFEYDFKVTSFTMIIPQGAGYFSTEKSDSQMFSQSMKDQIQNLKKNDIIVFSDIRVRGPEGPRKIESINITIN